MSQEQKIFQEIAEARTRYAGAQTTDEKAVAAGQVETALGRLLVIMENYPQLKSIETVQLLMVQLEGTENRIAVERGRFNELVRNYNVSINQIPGKFLASWFGFSPRQFFQAAEGAQTVPQVKLNQ
jgi:LemA protein